MLRSLLLAGAFVACGIAFAGETDTDDPWTGRSQADLVQLLGEPGKVKANADGTKRLTYKLVRVAPPAIPPGTVPVNFPGVGLVARINRLDRSAPANTTVEPVEFDEKGRPKGGGVTTSESATITWDKEDGKRVDSTAESHPKYRGKVRLTFEVDAEGRIVSWSVSPKKAGS